MNIPTQCLRRPRALHLHQTLTRTLPRLISSTPSAPATPLPHPTVSGPAPKAPSPSVDFPSEQIQRKRKQAALLSAAQSAKTSAAKPATVLQKRFWKNVDLREVEGGYEVLLDARPVRRANKEVLVVPKGKEALAVGIALEWDTLVSAQQALKSQYIPLTSLTSRALDLAREDASGENGDIRTSIIEVLLGYLRTDTLLCWAPSQTSYQDFSGTTDAARERPLRDAQEEAAKPIVDWLTTRVWPGVQLHPALDEGSIMPKTQPEFSVQIVKGWLAGLPAWELAGLERAVLASKSLCIGTRLIVEWSGKFGDVRRNAGASPLLDEKERGDAEQGGKFDVYAAHRACTLEVAYQTRNWGEVEDTHDVDREDVRRQLGSAVLLVQ